MGIFEISTIVIVITALFSYINYRTIRLPTTIGVMVIALVASLAMVGLGHLGIGGIEQTARGLLENIDFDETLLHGMLAFLLFAGALHVNLDDLRQQKWVITILATVGIIASTFMVGSLTWLVLKIFGLDISYLYCLLFGALISPTDPIAVLGLMKTANAPKTLETKIAGESLFNDGIGVVVFIALLGMVKGGQDITVGHVALLFLEEAAGGIVFGLALGFLVYQMLKRVDNYQVEVLLTLAMVMGGYALAELIHTSAPLAIVVAGLLIGNHGRSFAMSDTTREHLDTFWELLDQILNAVLFVMIGLELLVMPFTPRFFMAGVFAIPIVLLARTVSVTGTVKLLQRWREFTPGATPILIWGGLRGGISVALALSVPPGPERTVILAITYVVVVFSIIVQGLTIERVTKRSLNA